jgi:type I restriction enzyme S subunit
MTELGPLPEEWEVVRLGEILRPVSRQARQIRVRDQEFYSLLSTRLYGHGVGLKKTVLGISLKTKTWFKVIKGDFLLLKIWARKGAYGFVNEEYNNPIVSSDYPVLQLDRIKADENYVSLFLIQPRVWQSLSVGARGATSRQRVHEREFLEIVYLPLPPLPEQRAIAHVLRTVQQAREATEFVIQATRELKRSLMRHLFTYGPMPVGEADKVPLKDTAIGPLPEEWEVARLGEIFEIQQGKALSPKHRAGKSPLPFLRTANVFWGRIDLSVVDEMDFTTDEVQRLRLLPRDLLVCEGGDIGRTAIWRGELQLCSYQNHLHRLRAKREIEPEFYMYWMQAAILLFGLYPGQGNKTTIPNLSKSRLAGFGVPLPPLPEQHRIAHILAAVDQKIEVEQKRQAALQALFQTLLHLLMTGQVRVKDLSLEVK